MFRITCRLGIQYLGAIVRLCFPFRFVFYAQVVFVFIRWFSPATYTQGEASDLIATTGAGKVGDGDGKFVCFCHAGRFQFVLRR